MVICRWRTEQSGLASAIVERIYDHPRVTLIVLLVLTLVAGAIAMRMQLDQSIEVWFLRDDPALQVYQQFTDRFQADEILVIGVFAHDVFDPATWEAINELAQSAARLPFVHRVLTANNLGFVNPYPDEFEPTLKEQVLGNSLLRDTFVSTRGDAAAIVLQLTRAGNTFANKRILVEALQELLAQHSALDTRVAGTPITDDAAMRHNENDMARVVPLMILIILVTCYLCFRRLAPTILPLAIVLIAALWMYGLMGALGYQFTLVSTTLLPLILAVGVADSVHILTQYGRQRASCAHRAATINAVSRLLTPCFFTSATTAAGLLALLVSDLAPIREFGLAAAFGVLAAFVISVCGLPAALALLGEDRFAAPATGRHVVAGAMSALASDWSDRRRGIIVAVALVVLLLFGALIPRLSVGVDPVAWYDEQDPVLVDALKVDRAFGGSLSVEFLVSGDSQALKDRAMLQRIDEFERWLERETPVSHVLSLVDILKEMGRSGQPEDDAEPVLPSAAGLDLVLTAATQPYYAQWIDAEYAHARLWARIPLTAAAEAIRAMPRIEAQADEHFRNSGLAVEITGYARLMVEMQDYILRSQIETLLLAFAIVALLIALLLRSLLLAGIAMLINMVPVVLGIGMMPLVGVSLNPGTVMVGAIVLGIVVDDTVHFLSALRRHGAELADMRLAIRHTLDEVGTPVFVTSLVLAAGFGTLMFGSFVPSREVGLVTAVVILAALLADLLLLPAVLQLFPSLATRRLAK